MKAAIIEHRQTSPSAAFLRLSPIWLKRPNWNSFKLSWRFRKVQKARHEDMNRSKDRSNRNKDALTTWSNSINKTVCWSQTKFWRANRKNARWTSVISFILMRYLQLEKTLVENILTYRKRFNRFVGKYHRLSLEVIRWT